MIRFASFLAALIALVSLSPAAHAGGALGGDASACTAGGGPAIQANIVGLKDRQGELKLELYPATADDFLKDDTVLAAQGKTFRRVAIAAPQAGAVSLCIRAPHPGRYALLFTHNRDSKNKFSVWNDGAGVVSNAKLGRSKPKVDQSTIDVGNAVTVVTIRAQYLHGFSGFGPN